MTKTHYCDYCQKPTRGLSIVTAEGRFCSWSCRQYLLDLTKKLIERLSPSKEK